MPAYKDKDRGTWYCCFYYTDWQGEQQRKTKRGFTKQKDAKEWERAFLDKLQENPQMTMASLISLYNTDMASRLRDVNHEQQGAPNKDKDFALFRQNENQRH